MTIYEHESEHLDGFRLFDTMRRGERYTVSSQPPFHDQVQINAISSKFPSPPQAVRGVWNIAPAGVDIAQMWNNLRRKWRSVLHETICVWSRSRIGSMVGDQCSLRSRLNDRTGLSSPVAHVVAPILIGGIHVVQPQVINSSKHWTVPPASPAMMKGGAWEVTATAVSC